MFSTFNLSLNYIRVTHWFKGNVTLAFDHTFKMDIKNRPHFTVNVMVRALPLVCAGSPTPCSPPLSASCFTPAPSCSQQHAPCA